MEVFTETGPSQLSQAILNGRKLEKAFYRTHILPIDRERKRIQLNADRHMETFLRITRKRHEAWYRHDKYFRDALQKEKDRHEARKRRCGSSTDSPLDSFSSLLTINSLPERSTKTEQRTRHVLQASQKLLDESAATRSRSQSSFSRSRPSTALSNAGSFHSASLILPMTQSIDADEYARLMNASLQRETYGDFVDHFVKFRPEFREQFAQYHQDNQRQLAVEKLRARNRTFSARKDERYDNLVDSLVDFRLGPRRKQNRV